MGGRKKKKMEEAGQEDIRDRKKEELNYREKKIGEETN